MAVMMMMMLELLLVVYRNLMTVVAVLYYHHYYYCQESSMVNCIVCMSYLSSPTLCSMVGCVLPSVTVLGPIQYAEQVYLLRLEVHCMCSMLPNRFTCCTIVCLCFDNGDEMHLCCYHCRWSVCSALEYTVHSFVLPPAV